MVRSEILAFCRSISSADLLKLPFQKPKFEEVDNAWLVNQARCYQLAKTKLPGWWRLGKVVFPDPQALEQCTSEWVARWKATLIPEEVDTLIDLSAGLGVDAFFLGKDMNFSVLLETEPLRASLMMANLNSLNQNRLEVLSIDAHSFLCRYLDQISPKTLVYIDPDRRSESGKRLVSWRQTTPDLKSVFDQLRPTGCRFMAKLSPLDDPDEICAELPGCESVYTVSLHNEVKELLFVWNFQLPSPSPQTKAVEISRSGVYREMETDTSKSKAAQFQLPETGEYLYDPWAGIRKNYQTGLISTQFGAHPVSTHSQLFTSPLLISDFPGRLFRVEDQPANLKSFGQQNKHSAIHVVSRGKAEPAESIKKKFGFQDGGNRYLFCFQGPHNQTHLLLCKRIDSPPDSRFWKSLPL